MDCLSDDGAIVRVSPFVVIKAFINNLAILPAAYCRLAELGALSVLEGQCLLPLRSKGRRPNGFRRWS